MRFPRSDDRVVSALIHTMLDKAVLLTDRRNLLDFLCRVVQTASILPPEGFICRTRAYRKLLYRDLSFFHRSSTVCS